MTVKFKNVEFSLHSFDLLKMSLILSSNICLVLSSNVNPCDQSSFKIQLLCSRLWRDIRIYSVIVHLGINLVIT